jgi:signal transduction histidine kinase/CheY-like chemotaxis protein
MRMTDKQNTLIIRFTLFFSLFALALFFIVFSTSVQQNAAVTSIISTQFGIPIAKRAMSLIDGDAFERLANTLDPSDPFYEEACRKLYDLNQKSQCLYLYTEVPVDGQTWRYIADGSAPPGEPGFSALGDTVGFTNSTDTASKLKYKVMLLQVPQPGQMVHDNEWGWSITCYAPIINSAGKSVGVIGCDFDAFDIHKTMQQTQMMQIGYAVGFFVLGLRIYLFLLTGISNQQKQFQDLSAKAVSASVAKSKFLAKTSHEIRTPMNAILGMTELLLRRDISSEAYEDVLNIKHAGQNLLAIINDILDFSKIESGKMRIVQVNYQLTSLLNDVINIIRMRITEKAIRFVVNVNSRLPNNLKGDVVRIRQVLLNLLSNAVKYTHAGHIALTVVGEPIPATNRIKLLFSVSDTGIGIKPEDIGNLFGEFIQIDVEKNLGLEGTGLGLAIGKNLCKLMDGDILVDSVYGKGSVFTAVIPQEIRNNELVAYVPDAETKRTLLLERRAVNLESIVASLENLGVPVTSGADNETFFGELRKGCYAFAFSPLPTLKQTIEIIDELGLRTTPVLLAEIGTTIVSAVASIHMPAYALSIANVLNGITETQDSEKAAAYFTAPDARILVVDDITANLRVAEGLLAVYQVQVDTASTGRDAIAFVEQNRYDIVFMDHMMPGMDGIESTRIIRGLGQTPDERETMQTLPIIALTANAMSGMKEMFLQSGFNDYLSKPIEIPKLDKLMEKWIPQVKKRRGTARDRQRNEALTHIAVLGADADRGRAMTGGTESGYRIVLAAFAKDAVERLEFLASPPDREKLPLFVTTVHALKSACATIGAEALSQKAATLEAAGKLGDMETISRQLDDFRSGLGDLVDNITEALDAVEIGPEQDPSAYLDESVFFQKIDELCAYIRGKNMRLTDKILLDFEKESCTVEQKKIIDAISDYVLMCEYDSAGRLIHSLHRQEQDGERA